MTDVIQQIFLYTLLKEPHYFKTGIAVLYHTRILYHTLTVHTIRVWYVPYAYGMYRKRMV